MLFCDDNTEIATYCTHEKDFPALEFDCVSCSVLFPVCVLSVLMYPLRVSGWASLAYFLAPASTPAAHLRQSCAHAGKLKRAAHFFALFVSSLLTLLCLQKLLRFSHPIAPPDLSSLSKKSCDLSVSSFFALVLVPI